MPEFSIIEMLNFKLFIEIKDEYFYCFYLVIDLHEMQPDTGYPG